jgi:hypothetical protein
MSSETVTTAICDRCGHTEAGGKPSDLRGWGSVSFHSYEVFCGVYPHDESGDLCPKCMSDLQVWWDAPKSTAKVPA